MLSVLYRRQGVRDADTVSFFPKLVPFSQVTPDLYLRQAAADIVDILKSPQQKIHKLTYGHETTNAFIHVAQMLKRAIPPAKPINKTKSTGNPSTASINIVQRNQGWTRQLPPQQAQLPQKIIQKNQG